MFVPVSCSDFIIYILFVLVFRKNLSFDYQIQLEKQLMTHQKQRRFKAQHDLYLNPEVDNYGCFGFLAFNSCNTKDANQSFYHSLNNYDSLSGASTPINQDGKTKQSLRKKQNSPQKRASKHNEKKTQNFTIQLPRTPTERYSINTMGLRQSEPFRRNTSQNIYLKPANFERHMIKQKSNPNLTNFYRNSQPQKEIKKPAPPTMYYSPRGYIGLHQNLPVKKLENIPQFQKDLRKISEKEQTELVLGRLSKKIQSQQIEKQTRETLEDQQELIESQNANEDFKSLPTKKAENFNDFKIRKVDSIKDQSEIEASIVLSKWQKQSTSDAQGQSVMHNIANAFPTFSKQLFGTRH